MFGSVLTLAYTALLAYVLWRADSVPVVRRHVSRRRVLGIGAVFLVVFLAGRFYGHHGSGAVALALEYAGMVLLGTVLLVATALLVVDVFTLFGGALRKNAPTLRGIGLVVGLGLAVIALVQGHCPPAVIPYEVSLSGLPQPLDGTVLIAVSDAHVGNSARADWLGERAGEIRDIGPDAVVFLGDMFEGHGDLPSEIPGLGRIAAPLGKWYVHGNHEAHGERGGGDAILEGAGFARLDNRWVSPAAGLVFAGVSDLSAHRRRRSADDPIGRALAGRPAGATVLLSHSPWGVEHAARGGVGLMLSGHTHGGQIWPFGYLVGAFYPLLAGRAEVGGMTLIVSRGANTWGPPMRLWHRGDILKITLRSGGGHGV